MMKKGYGKPAMKKAAPKRAAPMRGKGTGFKPCAKCPSPAKCKAAGKCMLKKR